LPYKRFATPSLLALAAQYLHRTDATYRSVVRHQRSLIGYPVTVPNEATAAPPAPPEDEDRDENPDHDPQHQAIVPPSLPWRFIGWLGSLTEALCRAREMLLELNPNSTCHRVSGSVDPFKARSPERMATLETARQLVLIIPEWEACFDSRFFPRFATRSGFG
jgi:hypothetical protein